MCDLRACAGAPEENKMKKIGWKVLVLATATAAGGSVLAQAQYRPERPGHVFQDRDHDGDHDRDDARRDRNEDLYRQGLRQGRWDAEHNQRAQSRRWNNDRDRRSFEAGYNQGFRDALNARARYGNNNGRFGNGQWGRYGQGAGGRNGRLGPNSGQYGSFAASAQRFGYQDGVNDGLKDRQTGHSYRPTHDDSYKDADRGYNSSLGSKDQYKQLYRQAYAEGYQRGYYGNGGGYFGR